MSGSMKASVCQYSCISDKHTNSNFNQDVAKSMDTALPTIEESLRSQFAQFGQRKGAESDSSIFDDLDRERFSQSKGPLTEVRKK